MMSETPLYSLACIEAVKKSTSELVSLLSGGVVGLSEFGQALVTAKFTERSGLKDALDTSLLLSQKTDKLSQILITQVQNEPEKYYKAYLSVLEQFDSLHFLLEKTKGYYRGKSILSLHSQSIILIMYSFTANCALSIKHDSKSREVEDYQQWVKIKDEKIASLNLKLQALEARINQAESQHTPSKNQLDKAMMDIVDLRGELEAAENEKHKAHSHLLEARDWIKTENQEVMNMYNVVIIIMICLHQD